MVEKDLEFPVEYIRPVVLNDGTIIQLRPIHPSDGQYAESFKASLSKESLHSRFFGNSPKITPSIVKLYVDLDYSSRFAIIAEHVKGHQKEVIGVGRIAPDIEDENVAEIAVIISDNWQNKGLGNLITDDLIYICRKLGYHSVHAYTYKENKRMIEILKTAGFEFVNEDFQTLLGKKSIL